MPGLNPLDRRADDDHDRPAVLVAGGAHLGTTLAAHLGVDNEVTFVSRTPEAVERAARDGVDAHHVESIDAQAFREVGADRASVAIAASEADSVNLLAAQLLRTGFDVERVVARVNHPSRLDAFRDLGVEPVCLSTAVLAEMSDRFEIAVDELQQH